MSTMIYATHSSVDVPLPQEGLINGPATAPVLEFLCLFTHDLRRKQKRWQDGRLKYHAFNKRVMVYDERGNFVGDAHWCCGYEFGQGEEVQLERGGIIVQVSECVGRRDQDLSELLDKRAREKEHRQASASSRLPVATPVHRPASLVQAQGNHFQLRHRPLQDLITTAVGGHPRASIPLEPPHNGRQTASNAVSDEDMGSRPSKRPRYQESPPSKTGYARSLFGATLTLSGGLGIPAGSQPRSKTPAKPVPSHQKVDGISEQEDMDVLEASGYARREIGNHPTICIGDADKMAPAPPHQPPGTFLAGSGSRMDETSEGSHLTRPDESGPGVAGAKTLADDSQMNAPVMSPVRKQPPTSVGNSASISGRGRDSEYRKRRRLSSEAGSFQRAHQKAGAIKPLGGTDGCVLRLARSTSPANSGQRDISLAAELGGTSAPPTRMNEITAESKTELRIKSTRRRGLLMVAERNTNSACSTARPIEGSRNSLPTDKPPLPCDETTSSPARGRQTGMSEPGQSPGAAPSADNLLVVGSARLAKPLDTSRVQAPTAIQRGCNTRQDNNNIMIIANSPTETPLRLGDVSYEHFSVAEAVKSKRTLQRTAREENTGGLGSNVHGLARSRTAESRTIGDERLFQLGSDGESLDFQGSVQLPEDTSASVKHRRNAPRAAKEGSSELPDVPLGPRLAKLGRKSVKSKEVLGLDLGALGFTEKRAGQVNTSDNDRQRHRVPGAVAAKPHPVGGRIGIDPPPEASLGDREARRMLDSKDSSVAVNQKATSTMMNSARPLTTQSCRARASVQVGSEASHIRTAAPCVHPSVGHAKCSSRVGWDYGSGGPSSEEALNPVDVPAMRKPSCPPVRQTSETAAEVESAALPAIVPENQKADSPGLVGPAPAVPTGPAPGPAKISNPATRGRKAALKSDAAGQVPQPIVRPDPVPQRRPEGGRAGKGEGETRRKMVLPGFVSANGGPWSREAHDLLEIGRPR